MDQNSNVNLKVVQGDFPIKYGPKTLKTPMVNLLKNLRPFQNYFLKIQWESESACFLVQALPTVQNQFLKQFSNKVLHNYCSKFFFGGVRSVFGKVKK